MIELQRKIVTVKFEGTEYKVRVPNAREIKEIQGAGESDIDQTIGLLDRLGLPSAVAWELDAESLQKIFEALIPAKKS